MVGKYQGMLVGYRTYDKKIKDDKGEAALSKTQHVYDVFCKGIRTDKTTGLCMDECKVISVIEDDQVLKQMQYAMPVEFYGEANEFMSKGGERKTSIRYFGIEAVEVGGKGGKA